MAVMIPHNYKGEDFQIVISPSKKDNYVEVCVAFQPVNDRNWQSGFLVAREMVSEPDFYNWVCSECVSQYHKSLVKEIVHSKFDENNSGK